MTIGVVIADDQALVRGGFRKLLDGEPDLTVMGEVADGSQAVEKVRALNPNVVLMDIRMPHMDGIEATRRSAAISTTARVLILTTYDLDEYVFEALRAGASGFLLKDAPPEHLLAAIRAIAAGDALLDPAVTRRLIETFINQPRPDQRIREAIDGLTTRELEVLRLIARGYSNAEMARELFLSEATVKSHVSSLLSKLSVRDRVQAVVFAYENGIVKPGAT